MTWEFHYVSLRHDLMHTRIGFDDLADKARLLTVFMSSEYSVDVGMAIDHVRRKMRDSATRAGRNDGRCLDGRMTKGISAKPGDNRRCSTTSRRRKEEEAGHGIDISRLRQRLVLRWRLHNGDGPSWQDGIIFKSILTRKRQKTEETVILTG